MIKIRGEPASVKRYLVPFFSLVANKRKFDNSITSICHLKYDEHSGLRIFLRFQRSMMLVRWNKNEFKYFKWILDVTEEEKLCEFFKIVFCLLDKQM